MPSYGSRCERGFYALQISVSIAKGTLMSAAIIRLYHLPGFVIGADGRETQGSDHHLANESTQKVFPLIDGNNILAYSFCGSTRYTSDSGDETIWNLADDVRTAAQSLSGHRSRTLHEYAEKLATEINLVFRKAKTNGKISEYPIEAGTYKSDAVIAELFLDGFYSGVASRAAVKFLHRNQELMPPAVHLCPLDKMGWEVNGPCKIAGLFFDDQDLTFIKYRKPGWLLSPASFNDVTAVIDGFIRACSSPEAQALDPTAQFLVGGHTHIAIVTPEGFRWAKGYEPLPDPSGHLSTVSLL